MPRCWSSQLQRDRIPPVKRPAAIPQHAIKIAVHGFGTAPLNDGAFTGEPAIYFAVLGSAAARPRRQSHSNVLCKSDTITDFQLFLPASLRTSKKLVAAEGLRIISAVGCFCTSLVRFRQPPEDTPRPAVSRRGRACSFFCLMVAHAASREWRKCVRKMSRTGSRTNASSKRA